MLSIILNWIIIGVYAFLYGKAGISILYKGKEKALNSADIFIVCGIMILNVYAQFFSVFHRVSAMAFLILTIGAIGCAYYLIKIVNRYSYTDILKNRINIVWKNKDRYKFRLVLVMVAAFGTILWTNLVPQHYDTYLYHAQAIHWIEDFGVVPGLGNLHFRLAYNSAFMTVQALFSWTWLLGQSLHTVNGFVALFMLLYVIFTFHTQHDDKLKVSDMLKLAAIVYLVYNSFHISSPNTDTWALLLINYICIKWSEYVEEGEKSPLPYSFLCLLCVYAMTLKLSVVAFIVLTIYPAVLLVVHKCWKQIIGHISAGFFVVLPWFVRNLIISGYLIYPYCELDFFHFDWEMPKETLIEDRKEIIAWGRGNMDTERYGDLITQWVPEWYRSIHPLWQILFVVAVISGIILLYYILKNLRSRRNAGNIILICAVLAGALSWFLSAPLPRYGIIYMMFLPCILVGLISQRDNEIGRHMKGMFIILCRKVKYVLATMILLYSLLYFPYIYIMKSDGQTFFLQNDYANRDVCQYDFAGYNIAAPVSGDQTGYEPFPATPYPGVIDSIVLRGESFQSGFRKK